MKDTIKVPIEVQSIGENKLFLHIELGKGTYGKRKVRMIQAGTHIIFQVYKLDGKGCDTYTISLEALGKSFIKAVEKFEKVKELLKKK